MEALSLKELVKTLKALKGRTAITFHSMGDVDGVASAFALKKLIKNSDVRRIDAVNSQARKVWRKLNLQLEPFLENELEVFDNLIFVDVSTQALLGTMEKAISNYKGKVIAIDHHTHNHPIKAQIYCDPKKTSCSEVIFDIYREFGKKVDDGEAVLIALGILSDTANMKSANSSAIFALSECLNNSSMELQELFGILEVREDVSEKIAVLEGIKRAQYERIGECLIASTQVGAFELRCAAALIEIGCDFAVCANQKDGKISAVKGDCQELKGFDIGKELDMVAKQLHGNGGGHDMVGGARFTHGLDAISASDKLMAKVREQIG